MAAKKTPTNDVSRVAEDRRIDQIAYAQRERLAFIEMRLFFCGSVTRAQIEARFGIKPAASARDLMAYRALAPDNLIYKPALRCYRPTAGFVPVFRHSMPHVLNWLRSGMGDALEAVSSKDIACESVHDLVQPDLSTLATITRAIVLGLVLESKYLSISSGELVKRLAPLALVDTGFRWHLRAYDQQKSRFADFVVTRIASARAIASVIPPEQKLSQDTQWNRVVSLQLLPHPSLAHPAAIELEYGMTDGRLLMEVRAPLVGYALKRWSVDCTPGHTLSSESHHLWLSNADVLQGVESAFMAPGFAAIHPATKAEN